MLRYTRRDRLNNQLEDEVEKDEVLDLEIGTKHLHVALPSLSQL